MLPWRWIVAGVLAVGLGAAACKRSDGAAPRERVTAEAPEKRAVETPSMTVAPSAVAEVAPAPRVVETITGNFRGKGSPARVLLLEGGEVALAWDEGGKEHREPVTKEPPPGHRECKALRSGDSQDFLLCMTWYTGPGGGRVDGVVLDLKRRIWGEFFSAATNFDVVSTLCFPEVAMGPMPSFNMTSWRTTDGGEGKAAEVHVTVARKGWTTQEAVALRARPLTKQFCACAGSENCTGEPKAPESAHTIRYRLERGELHPTDESRAVLGDIAAQWGHSADLRNWNLEMRSLPTPAADANTPAPSPSASANSPSDPCTGILERARGDLLARGFAPTNDTASWLRVTEEPHAIELSLELRTSADGAATWYTLLVDEGQGESAWQKADKVVCCDEHATREDNIRELTWKRRHRGASAEVSVGYFGSVREPAYLAERALFVEVAKRAADECLVQRASDSESGVAR